MDVVKTIVFVLLGWLLGLLSPRIIESIQRRYRRTDLRKSLFIELEGLRVTLASLLYVIASNDGTVNRELIELVEPIMREDKNFRESKPTAEVLGSLLKLTDEQFAINVAPKKPTGPISLKKISVPFLTSQLSSLYLFSPEFQRTALKICSRLAIINEEIDVAAFNYKKTFDRLPQQDHAIVVTNFIHSYRNIFGLCRPLIDDVNLLLSMKK
ncbi:MAG TPA: hypothetical protein DC054_24220 [Blastocatellia bacterium]|nr:hypothetical protein [Blastocatellia bacterium]